MNMKSNRGFTLIELLVVIAIIGTISAIVMMALDQSRAKGRDGARKSQITEILKGLELFYSDGGLYPLDGTPGDSTAGAVFSTIGSGFIGGQYFNRSPDQANTEYFYCVSSDRKSITLAVNTEQDKGGSNYCSVYRGPGPGYGCTAWVTANAADTCLSRF